MRTGTECFSTRLLWSTLSCQCRIYRETKKYFFTSVGFEVSSYGKNQKRLEFRILTIISYSDLIYSVLSDGNQRGYLYYRTREISGSFPREGIKPTTAFTIFRGPSVSLRLITNLVYGHFHIILEHS